MWSERRWVALAVALLACVLGVRSSATAIRTGDHDTRGGHGDTVVVARRSTIDALREGDDRRAPPHDAADGTSSPPRVVAGATSQTERIAEADTPASRPRRSPISARGPPR